MKKHSKYKISKLFCGNCNLNRKVLRLKRSWDEVESILGRGNKCNPKCKD
jgi:hypothetical protein